MKLTASSFGGLVVGSLLLLTQPLRAQADLCGALKPADLTTVLGEKAVATPHSNACMWKSADGVKKLGVVGGEGTAKDVDALRPVAKKLVAAL